MILKDFIDLKLSGQLPEGQMIVDNDNWQYCPADESKEPISIDPTEPAMLDSLKAWGITWEHI